MNWVTKGEKMSKYKMIVYTMKSGDSFDYVAEYPALKGVAGVGTNEFEAISDLLANSEVNIAALKDAGLPIPEEDQLQRTEYSGKLSVRFSSSLHRRLAEVSEHEGVSINQCIVEAVSMYVTNTTFESKVEKKIDDLYLITSFGPLKSNYIQNNLQIFDFSSHRKYKEIFEQKPIRELKHA